MQRKRKLKNSEGQGQDKSKPYKVSYSRYFLRHFENKCSDLSLYIPLIWKRLELLFKRVNSSRTGQTFERKV